MPSTLPPSIYPSLIALQQKLHKFWAKELHNRRLPLAFWKIPEDEIFFYALQYLPGCMLVYGGSSGEGHSDEDLRQLPSGFQLAVTVFELEDGFTCDGWTAIGNLGEERLRQVVAAYQAIGLPDRAAALSRVIEALAEGADDEAALSEAAQGGLPDLIDDDAASSRVVAFLREDADAKFGMLAEEQL